MTRLNQQLNDELVTKLVAMRHELDAIKSTQRMNSKVASSYTTSFGPMSFTLASGGRQIVLIFFNSDNQQYPFTTLSYQVYLTTTLNIVHPGMTGWPAVTQYENKALPKATQWTLVFYNSSGSSQTYLLNLSVLATDTGTLTAI